MLSRMMTRREQFVLAFFGIAIVVGSLVIYQRSSGNETRIPEIEQVPELVTAAPVELVETYEKIETSPTATAVTSEVVVSVQGAVLRPGLYTFHFDDRVQDALSRAGGLTDTADTAPLNLAAKLIDATTLTIPIKEVIDPDNRSLLKRNDSPPTPNPPAYTLAGSAGSSTVTGMPGSSISTDGRININTATQDELESLPGIGPAYASAIIQYREQHNFTTPEELMEIRGVGEKRFASIKDLISVK